MRIQAPASTVWNVLTQSDYTKRYMFGCEIVTDWRAGGSFDWRGAADGVVYVVGRLVDVQPNRLLRYTMFDPSSDLANVPANHLTATCELATTNDGTELSMVIGDFTTVGNGATRYEHTVAGGDTILVQIKEIAEAA